MKQTAVSVLVHFYGWLLRLYPSNFREEFGAEMEGVFQEQIMEAAAHGRIHLLQACWRELRDWPFHCLQTHWQVRQQRLATSTAAPPSWWDTAMTGLPYLLFALIVSLSSFVFLFGQATGLISRILFGYGFVFLLLLVLIAAAWRGWPVWSAAWLSFLFFFFLVLIAPWQLFGFLGQSPQMQPVQHLTSEVGFPLLWLAVLYALLARWPRSGLVAMLPTFGITWLLYLEFVPESLSLVVTAITWVWLGIVAIVLLRWRHHQWDVWLLYLAGVVVGLIYIFAAHYLTDMQVRDGSIAGMGENLLSELIPVLVPLAGILLLLTLRWWSQVNGPAAVLSYRLLFAGIVLTFIGLQTSLMMSRKLVFSWPENQELWVTAVLLLGCLLMVASIWLLVRNRRQWLPPVSWPLVGLLLLLPLMASIRWLWPGQLWLISRLASILWLVVAAWLIGAVRQKLPPVPAKKKASSSTAVQSTKTTISTRLGSMTRRQLIAFILGLILLVVLLLPTTTLAKLFPNDQMQPFDLRTSFPLFLIMTTGLIVAAALLSSGFNLHQAGALRTAVFFFVLSAFLLVVALRNHYWLAIWDTTYDGLGILWLFVPIVGVFVATLGLIGTLPKRAKMAAFFYLLVLPPILFLITQRTQQVDFYQLTERRAEQVNQALEAYHEREGHYPNKLHQLTPRHLRLLSEPMIIFGQDWCYDSDGEQYQFGYVYRQHWSNPNLIGYVYDANSRTNEEAAFPSLCREEITKLQARDPTYYNLLDEYNGVGARQQG